MPVSPSAALLVILAVSVASCGDGSSTTLDGTPRPTLTLPPIPPEPIPTTLVASRQGSPHVLPAGLADLTREIIENDPYVARLADGHAFFVEGIGGWYYGTDPETGDDLLVATVADVTLGTPVNHERIELPGAAPRSTLYALWPDDVQSRYDFFRHSINEYRLANIGRFSVEVDFHTEKVIDIDFLPTSPDEVAENLASTDDSGTRHVNDPSLPSEIELGALYKGLEEGSELTREIVDRHALLNELLDEAERVQVFGGPRFGLVYANWESSVQIIGDYPVIVDEDKETGDYRSVVVAMDEQFVRALTVRVDLQREEIIDLDPDEGD